ncbi:MAG: hypothetical protein ACYTCU_04630 [Planctomycetota bacterium]
MKAKPSRGLGTGVVMNCPNDPMRALRRGCPEDIPGLGSRIARLAR